MNKTSGKSTAKTTELFTEFVQIIAKLRNPDGGCPWDLKQTHQTLRPYLIEEVYEVLDALDSNNDQEIASELGDLLLQIVLHAQLAKERNAFGINDVVKKITEKMIRRHPHVFGDKTVADADEVLKNWEAIKQSERGSSEDLTSSKLSDLPRSLPALVRATRLGDRSLRANFDWKSREDVWAKVEEELGELKDEIKLMGNKQPTAAEKLRISDELGDVLFCLAQYARWLEIDAEHSLGSCCERFVERFRTMENLTDKPLEELNPEELEKIWQQAKKALEKSRNNH